MRQWAETRAPCVSDISSPAKNAGPQDLVAQAVKARDAGFQGLWISDHFHPWNDTQGHSPFVWATIGAIAQAGLGLPVDDRGHLPDHAHPPRDHRPRRRDRGGMLDGQFSLGVGSGEALNEHVLGDRWPEAAERLEMLEEAIDGDPHAVGRRGAVTTAAATIASSTPASTTCRSTPPPIIVSGFGPEASISPPGSATATHVGPDAESVDAIAPQGGDGPVQGGLKVCYGGDDAAARATVHRLWPNEALPGELRPDPAHARPTSSRP